MVLRFYVYGIANNAWDQSDCIQSHETARWGKLLSLRDGKFSPLRNEAQTPLGQVAHKVIEGPGPFHRVIGVCRSSSS